MYTLYLNALTAMEIAPVPHHFYDIPSMRCSNLLKPASFPSKPSTQKLPVLQFRLEEKRAVLFGNSFSAPSTYSGFLTLNCR
jgi:hypothetical protein